ncbi:MAG TPA: sodium/solute symporter [Candidatus Baltobacteraceae bacterium]|jgi:SSS family transporter|nr:sodium/solute symporter [Candidatus Baltobacteraceae bacterium]
MAPPSFLNAADWAVILLYISGIVALGSWFGRDQHNTRDYFLGGKDIPWWGIGLSIVAAETSALTIIGVPAMAYGKGGDLSFIQLIIGYVIARVLLAIVMVPHYFKGEIYSPYQLFSNAFGENARRTAGGFFLLSETLAAGVRVYVACIPVKLMLGDKLLGAFAGGDPILGAILLFVLISLVYTFVGGVKAVIWTDAVQFGLFLLGGLFTLWFVPHVFPGGASAVLRMAAGGGKLHWFNGDVTFDSVWREPMNIWMGVIGGTFMVMASHGAEQLIVQRVLACKNVRDGRKALVLSAVVIFPLFLIFLLAGAMLWVYYQKFSMPIAIPEIRPGSGIKANDFIFPIFILTAVPHILKGLLIVAILAAAMSSVSSALTALSSVSTMDFIKKALPGKSDAFFLRLSKISTVFWAAALIVVAYLSRRVEFVLNASFTLRGLTSGGLLGGLMLAVFWKPGRGLPVIAGMICSLAVMLWISPLGHSGAGIAPYWYTMIGCGITILVAVAARKLVS